MTSPVISTWRDTLSDAVVFDVGGFAQTTIREHEIIAGGFQSPRDAWVGFMQQRLAPLLWLAMPTHDDDGRSAHS